MIVSCKRPQLWEEIYDPLAKRYRALGGEFLEEEAACSDQEAQQTACAVIDAYKTAAEKRGRPALPDDGPSTPGASPSAPEKRTRHTEPTASAGGGVSARECTEAMVKSLHSCPSMEEAVNRCARVLGEFHDGVRASEFRRAAAEAAARERPPDDEDRPQDGSPKQTNQILMRAVYHLAQHSKKLEANSREAARLRNALEQSQDQLRRVAHSNEVLQGHLMVHLEERP